MIMFMYIIIINIIIIIIIIIITYVYIYHSGTADMERLAYFCSVGLSAIIRTWLTLLSMCAHHPCAGAMLIFSVSLQF